MLLMLRACLLSRAQDKLVLQQLGPAPPAHASPGMQLQYNTMFAERRRSLVLDNVCSLLENSAALLVKVAICRALTLDTLSSPDTNWRLLLLPCWCVPLAWPRASCAPLLVRPVTRVCALLCSCVRVRASARLQDCVGAHVQHLAV
jgi:hypothetical protein